VRLPELESLARREDDAPSDWYTMSLLYDRPVRFEEVDAAGLAFFAHFFHWCHEAMERFFDGVPGGYVGLIMRRRIGFPGVHLHSEWKTPLRYGDVARVELSVVAVGTTSCTFRYVITRGSDGAHVAAIEQVVVATDLNRLVKMKLPDDCRALIEAHL
jgi:YbgC/YbaW family acyl-CoA thioester hydrolase